MTCGVEKTKICKRKNHLQISVIPERFERSTHALEGVQRYDIHLKYATLLQRNIFKKEISYLTDANLLRFPLLRS